jgi:hypothetical protein
MKSHEQLVKPGREARVKAIDRFVKEMQWAVQKLHRKILALQKERSAYCYNVVEIGVPGTKYRHLKIGQVELLSLVKRIEALEGKKKCNTPRS